MRFSIATALTVALAGQATASSWFTKAPYNKWHETELERWLSDHDVPYPTPADRKDLENLVKSKWQSEVETPYQNWDAAQLQKYLEAKGQQVKKGTEKNKDSLVAQVKSSWESNASYISDSYSSVKDWIFDSWTDSQLKAFLDKNGIPSPQPRKRDILLKSARENYQSVADKAGEYSAYPGNWLYSAWSDSDIKSWLDARGIPAPQTSNRDKLLASIRRNSRLASLQAESAASSVSSGAASASSSASDYLFDTWSESKLKEWADKNGVKVPQGSTYNELVALVRKNYAKLTGDNVASSASSGYHAATSSAGNEFAKATDDAALKANDLGSQIYAQAIHYWEELQIAVGLKTNYASSASRSAYTASSAVSSAYDRATKAAKGEL